MAEPEETEKLDQLTKLSGETAGSLVLKFLQKHAPHLVSVDVLKDSYSSVPAYYAPRWVYLAACVVVFNASLVDAEELLLVFRRIENDRELQRMIHSYSQLTTDWTRTVLLELWDGAQ